MIPVSSDVKIWIAAGHTDIRRGMATLARQVEQHLGRRFHDGDLFVFRGRRGDLVKILWSDALGVSLYSKRLARGHFIWPSAKDGAIPLTPSDNAGQCRHPGDPPDPAHSAHQCGDVAFV